MTDYAVVVTWPQYPITTSAGHVTGLGHAGVVIVDGGSGATRYFEYGRYGDKDSEGNRAGAVLTKSVKNLTISDGAITQSSFEKMIDGLSHSAGKNTIAHGSILTLSDGGFSSALDFAKAAEADPKGLLGDYALILDENTCYTFAKAVAAAGGSWVDWNDGFLILDNIPSAAIAKLQSNMGGFIIGGPDNMRLYFAIPSGTLLRDDHCFLAGTQISMWDGTKKPIEQVEAGDIVTSYDKDGNLKPGRVKRTMTNRAKQILDVHGLMVTPGHATLCGDGRFDGQHVPILDILRSDGALVLEDGSKMRAGTGCRLGTMGDRMLTAIIGEQ